MNDATTLDRPVQPTLQVRQIVPGQNYREHYDAKALADLREQVKAAGGIKSPIMVRPHPSGTGCGRSSTAIAAGWSPASSTATPTTCRSPSRT